MGVNDEMDTHNLIVSTLYILMAERGYRINDVHKGANISKTAISNLIDNKSRGIQYDTLNKLCNFFSITPNELLAYTPNQWGFKVYYTDGIKEIESDEVDKYNKVNIKKDLLHCKFKWNRQVLDGEIKIEYETTLNNESLCYLVVYFDTNDTNDEFYGIERLHKSHKYKIISEIQDEITKFILNDTLAKNKQILMTARQYNSSNNATIKIINNECCELKSILPLNYNI